MNLPNKITLSRIFFVPLFLLFIIPIPEWILQAQLVSSIRSQLDLFNEFVINYGKYFAAGIFILASSTDGVDGHLARKNNQVTNFGKFLDPIADKLLTTAALIALVERGDITSWVAMIIVGRELIVTGLRLIAACEGIVISASKLGKLKQIIQVIAISLTLLGNFPLKYLSDFRFDKLVMFIAVIITIYSGYDYIAKNKGVIINSDI